MIENSARYEAAIERNIRNNRRIGNRKRWEQESGEDVVRRCMDFLGECGEFARTDIVDEDGYITSSTTHPLVKVSYGQFYAKMGASLNEWGRLSPGQERAVLAMIEKAQNRIAEREAAKAKEQATCEHVGTVGERITLEGTITFSTSYDTAYGTTYVTGIKDAAGNIYIQKGVPLGQRGDNVWIKATVKEHAVRDGVKQTIISRPKHI